MEFAVSATPYQLAVIANSIPEEMPEHGILHGFAADLATIRELPEAKKG